MSEIQYIKQKCNLLRSFWAAGNMNGQLNPLESKVKRFAIFIEFIFYLSHKKKALLKNTKTKLK